MPSPSSRRLFPPLAAREAGFVGDLLRTETVSGALVLTAAVIAVLWANSPVSDAYTDLRHLSLGPLDLEHWAADGALALFFYIAGLEVKRELLVGSLKKPADALVPIVAAAAGVGVPALVYVAVNLAAGGRLRGWAIPAATDIAFALAVLAVVGSGLPTQLRAFLLTLAVVDDLIVIAIIAVFYTSSIHLWWLAAAVGLLGVFTLLQRLRGEHWAWYVPLVLGIWWCVHQSGVHATVAGVAMGLLTRVLPDEGEDRSPAEVLEHILQPWSAGIAVPFFALMSAGVDVHAGALAGDPVVVGVVLGLVLGKPVGVIGGAWAVTRLTRAELHPELRWLDLVGVGVLAGVGFTVALLVSDLSFEPAETDAAKTAVLVGSLVSAVAAGLMLRRRGKGYERRERRDR
jgi:NhaA family Na+:H+ antiporter